MPCDTIQGFSIMKPAIFLDRDGVIIENRDAYVQSWADVHIFEQALYGLKRYADADYYFIIVTNQSAVGRGIISLKQAQEINKKLVKEIESFGGRIDAVYMCPHAPDDKCECRKPEPGLILQAIKDFDIDLQDSIMIGDALTDLIAAESARIDKRVLVRTGRGKRELLDKELFYIGACVICDDLSRALDVFL